MIDGVRSILFTLAFYLGSAVIVPIGAAASLVHAPAVVVTARLWAKWFWFCARHVMGMRIVVRGTVPVSGVIVASKHQSAFETIATLVLWKHPAVVLKAELMAIPFWGYLARRHGAIPVDRDASTAAMRSMMRAAQAAIDGDRPIVIFPEGSRMPVGEAPALKAGVAGLYRMLKLPVVPVALDTGRVWPPRTIFKRRGTITFAFGPTIPAGLDRRVAEAAIHEAINRDPVTAPVA